MVGFQKFIHTLKNSVIIRRLHTCNYRTFVPLTVQDDVPENVISISDSDDELMTTEVRIHIN